MKLNDYFLVSDLQRLTSDEYKSLVIYLSLIGIQCRIEFEKTQKIKSPDLVLTACTCDGVVRLIWSTTRDDDLKTQVSYEDLKRMSSLGDFSNENA